MDVADVGPENNDKVVELIETMSDHGDRCLLQRGDQPIYAPDRHSGYYVNEGYQSLLTLLLMVFVEEFWISFQPKVPNSFTENGNISTLAFLETCGTVL